MNWSTWATLSLYFVVLFLAPASGFAQSPADFSWSDKPPNVASVQWTNQQIADFIGSITSSDQPPSYPLAVSDFQFVDLYGDGQLELLAPGDATGRGFFNGLEVVRKVGDQFTDQEITTLGAGSLSGMIADVDHDGKQELLVLKALTPYLGVTAGQATWTAIYESNGSFLVDMSPQFSAYYRTTILPKLKQDLDKLKAEQPGSLAVDVAQIGYDKTLRVSGVNPLAGLEQALTWSTNANATRRLFAAFVLADIGTPDALSTLKTLMKDPDHEVARYSEMAWESLPDLHFTRVNIDIKPGDSTNAIMATSKGSTPVAILSTPTFNAPESVDRKSLKFGPDGISDSLRFCNPKGEDVNGDGLLDLVCHFDTQAASFDRGEALGTLRGKLNDGSAIKGSDTVLVIMHSKGNGK